MTGIANNNGIVILLIIRIIRTVLAVLEFINTEEVHLAHSCIFIFGIFMQSAFVSYIDGLFLKFKYAYL